MRKSSLIAIALAMLLVPSMVLASINVVQDSCRTVWNPTGNKWSVVVYFSVVNFDSPTPICGVNFVVEGQPPDPGCIMVACNAPAGWGCNVTPNVGANYAATTGPCVTAGHIVRGFSFTLDPEFCCYRVWFIGPNGVILDMEEVCYSCVFIGTQPLPWSNVKQLYR